MKNVKMKRFQYSPVNQNDGLIDKQFNEFMENHPNIEIVDIIVKTVALSTSQSSRGLEFLYLLYKD